MTYTASSGTLNPAHSLSHSDCLIKTESVHDVQEFSVDTA